MWGLGELLAVYGLLRPGSAAWTALGLSGRVRVLSPCVLAGRLVDLGAYPGLIEGRSRVRGDLLRLEDPTLGPLLDAFEDYDPAAPTRSGFVRRRVGLIRPRRAAWAYVWTGARRGPVVSSGDWPAYAHGRGKGARGGGPR